jgi:hypothetical protein
MAGLLFTPREGSTVASSSVAPAAYAGGGRHGIRVAATTSCHRGHRSARGGRRRAAASGLRVSLRVSVGGSVGSNVRRALSFVCIQRKVPVATGTSRRGCAGCACAETMKRNEPQLNIICRVHVESLFLQLIKRCARGPERLRKESRFAVAGPGGPPSPRVALRATLGGDVSKAASVTPLYL